MGKLFFYLPLFCSPVSQMKKKEKYFHLPLSHKKQERKLIRSDFERWITRKKKKFSLASQGFRSKYSLMTLHNHAFTTFIGAAVQPVNPFLQQAAVRHNIKQTKSASHTLLCSYCVSAICRRIWLTFTDSLSLSHSRSVTHTRSHSRVGCSWTFALQHCAGSAPANPVARHSKPITVWGQMVNLYNIHFPASFPELACHPQRRVMHQGPVSQATQFELAQFIKPGPVHKPEFTRRRHLQQTAAAHSWWEGQADVQGKSKGETGESLWASVCQPQWEALHPLLKDRVQLAELVALSCLRLPWFSLSHSKHCNNSTCWQYQLSPQCSLFEPQLLWHMQRWSGSGVGVIIKAYPFDIVTLDQFIL